MNFFTRHVRPEWALVMVTALWGASFILLSISLKGLSPALLVALRFIGGALVMALILRSRLFNLRKEDWIAGFSAGSCIFLGYFLQTVGLQTHLEFDFRLPDRALRAFCSALSADTFPQAPGSYCFLRHSGSVPRHDSHHGSEPNFL